MERTFLLKRLITIRFGNFLVQLNSYRDAHRFTTKTTHADFDLEDTHIEEATQVNPLLAGIGHDLWRRAHETFVNHGLPTVSFLRIATGNPAILRHTPERIVASLEQWRICQFGEKNLHLLITKYPEMLDVDHTAKLHNHVAFLKSLVLTQKNVWQVLMNCPDLMEQSEETIKDKMQYLTDVMRIEVPEIVKSCTLSKSLQEIRTRHVFQERLGLFKARNPKTPELMKSTNDRLYKIMDTSEKTFATKVCHVTLEEYEVFKELFKRENKKKSSNTNKEYYNNIYGNEDDDENDDDLESDDERVLEEKKRYFKKS